MNNCCCFCNYRNKTPISPILESLPSSPNWISQNYLNNDNQPDEEYSQEKRIEFDFKINELLKKVSPRIISTYKNHPFGPITTELEYSVMFKRSRL